MITDPIFILSTLDQCCNSYTFPMLDNGYVYLAATRLSLFRSETDWAMVIEVFGFSPRTGIPDIHIHTFASRLYKRQTEQDYVNRSAYEMYLANKPHNDSRFVFPIEEGPWLDAENGEWLDANASTIEVRQRAVALPGLFQYKNLGIELEAPPRVHVFEACRYLASIVRDDVLATPDERRISVLPEMTEILVLDEWHHPNVAYDHDRPSGSKTFQQLAEVLATGNTTIYHPSMPPNTHWRNWPEGGTL